MRERCFYVDSTGPKEGGFYLSNFGPLKKREILGGWPHPAQQELFTYLRGAAQQEGLLCELVRHPLDDTLQGILFPEISAGAFGFDMDSSLLRGPGVLSPQGDLLAFREALSQARASFTQARTVHNGQERIYLEHMDFDTADRLSEALIGRLLGRKSGTRHGRELHRFFGSATAWGNKDHIPALIEDMGCRVFIKGRPGTGKSTLLKKVAAAALRRGCDVEIYHCALDVGSLDMVLVRKEGFCVLDSTPPHQYFPTREGDEIIDMYARCVVPGTDEAHAGELNKLEGEYKQLVQKATGHLKEALEALERLSFQPDPEALEAEKARIAQVLFG